jgi:hypothetical protein
LYQALALIESIAQSTTVNVRSSWFQGLCVRERRTMATRFVFLGLRTRYSAAPYSFCMYSRSWRPTVRLELVGASYVRTL